jgi:hypothetical protein
VNKNDTGVAAPKLESVLANLEGERAINTVEKTSRDWDDFKIREGIDDDLAQQAKDGYAVDTHLFLLKSPPPHSFRLGDSGIMAHGLNVFVAS